MLEHHKMMSDGSGSEVRGKLPLNVRVYLLGGTSFSSKFPKASRRGLPKIQSVRRYVLAFLVTFAYSRLPIKQLTVRPFQSLRGREKLSFFNLSLTLGKD